MVSFSLIHGSSHSCLMTKRFEVTINRYQGKCAVWSGWNLDDCSDVFMNQTMSKRLMLTQVGRRRRKKTALNQTENARIFRVELSSCLSLDAWFTPSLSLSFLSLLLSFTWKWCWCSSLTSASAPNSPLLILSCRSPFGSNNCSLSLSLSIWLLPVFANCNFRFSSFSLSIFSLQKEARFECESWERSVREGRRERDGKRKKPVEKD